MYRNFDTGVIGRRQDQIMVNRDLFIRTERPYFSVLNTLRTILHRPTHQIFPATVPQAHLQGAEGPVNCVAGRPPYALEEYRSMGTAARHGDNP